MSKKIKATPAARRLAAERGLDLTSLPLNPAVGYIRLDDIVHLAGRKKITPLAKAIADYHGININAIPAVKGMLRKNDVLAYLDSNTDETLPLSGIRKVIAKSMKASMDTIPQYTLHSEYDMFALKKAFSDYKKKCLEAGEIKPTFSDVFIKLFATALKECPIVNSTFTDDGIVIHKHINVGLAVAMPEDGLIVPNIKDADRKTLKEITKERAELVAKGREGKLPTADITGGTFTISNLGGFPVDHFTPIINIPESAIVGIGRTVDKVVAVDGNIGIHPVMTLSYTFDHRHLDGAVGGKFMAAVQEVFDRAEVIFEEEQN